MAGGCCGGGNPAAVASTQAITSGDIDSAGSVFVVINSDGATDFEQYHDAVQFRAEHGGALRVRSAKRRAVDV
jgi:hypothetical protein